LQAPNSTKKVGKLFVMKHWLTVAVRMKASVGQ